MRFCALVAALLATFCPIAAADEPLTIIALGSCARQNKPQPIWEHIVAAKPQLFLFIGDNIYGDTEDMAVMKEKYGQLAAQPGFKKLKATCPILATWDDHDYGVNDGGAEYPKKVESQQVFLDFFEVATDSPRRQREGIYDAAVFGPEGQRVQVILLDTRYFRSPLKKGGTGPGKGYKPNDDPQATVLGEAQWSWLEEQLRAPAELRIIASSIQVISNDHTSEKWGNFPLERDRLFKLIGETGAAGVLFISGDRHFADLSAIDAGIGYPLYDLTSSGLTNGHKGWRLPEPNRHRVAGMPYGDNFGLITIDWNTSVEPAEGDDVAITLIDPTVWLEVRDVEGRTTLKQPLRLSWLRPGRIAAEQKN